MTGRLPPSAAIESFIRGFHDGILEDHTDENDAIVAALRWTRREDWPELAASLRALLDAPDGERDFAALWGRCNDVYAIGRKGARRLMQITLDIVGRDPREVEAIVFPDRRREAIGKAVEARAGIAARGHDSLFAIVLEAQKRFALRGDDLADFVRRCLHALLDAGARPFAGDPRGGTSPFRPTDAWGTGREAIAEAIIADWLATGGGLPAWGAYPFAFVERHVPADRTETGIGARCED